MRLNVFLATSFLVTLVAGLVLPVTTYSSRDVDVHQRSVEGPLEVFVREPKKKMTYTVAAGKGNSHARESAIKIGMDRQLVSC